MGRCSSHIIRIEPIEPRQLLSVSVAINFQPGSAATPSGFISDTGAVYASRQGYTYGWNKANAHGVDRNASNSPDQAHDTYNVFRDPGGNLYTWEIALPNGQYSVDLLSGDAKADMGPNIRAEGVTILSGATNAAHRWIETTSTVTVSDGRLTLTNGSSFSKSAICSIKIVSTDPTTGPPTDPPTSPPPVPPATSQAWPSTSAWKLAASSPITRFESHSFSYGGKLYVMGGWADSGFHSTTRVDVFDPAANTWTRLHDMEAPNTHAGMAVDEANGVVYFVAGHRRNIPDSQPTNEFWKYTIATDTWEKLPAKLPYNMGANNAAIVDGKLYSFGGDYADRTTNTPDVFEIDLSDIAAGFTKVASLPSPRDHMASVVIDGKIYAIGGEYGHDKYHNQQSTLQVYDPATDKWTWLASAPGRKSHAESSTFVLNGKIIYAGGQIDTNVKQQPTSSVYQYDPATNKWSTLASLPAARQGTVVLPVGDYWVMTTGGIQTSQPQKTTWVVKMS